MFDIGSCFGGSWHSSDDDGYEAAVEDTIASSDPAQVEARFRWLEPRWSLNDQAYNRSLTQQADALYPGGTRGPVPSIEW